MLNYSLFRKQDFPGLLAVMEDTGYLRNFFPGLSGTEIKRRLFSSKITTLLCFDDGVVVGYFLFGTVRGHLLDERQHLSIDDSFAYHLGVGVRSDHRSKGIAKELTIRALELAKERGFKGVYADVGSDNNVSLRLQECTGFERLGSFSAKKRKAVENVVFVKRF